MVMPSQPTLMIDWLAILPGNREYRCHPTVIGTVFRNGRLISVKNTPGAARIPCR